MISYGGTPAIFIIIVFITASSVIPTSCFGQDRTEDILYTAGGQIFSVSPDGRRSAACSIFEADSPSWSPEGDKFAVGLGFGCCHKDPRRLAVFDSRCVLLKELEKSEDSLRPVWTPDGRAVWAVSYELKGAVARWDSGGRRLSDMPVRGFEDRYKIFQMLAIHPGQKRVAILLDDFQEILIADIVNDVLIAKKIIPRGFSYVSGAVWIHDNCLLFIGKKGTRRGELWETDAGNGSVKRIGIDKFWIRDYVAISPDRKFVVVCGSRDADGTYAGNSLWKYSLITHELLKLTNGMEDVDPSWRNK